MLPNTATYMGPAKVLYASLNYMTLINHKLTSDDVLANLTTCKAIASSSLVRWASNKKLHYIRAHSFQTITNLDLTQ